MSFDKRFYNERGPDQLDLQDEDSVTPTFDITAYSTILFSGVVVSGTWTATVVLEISMDGVVFIETAITLTAAGLSAGLVTAARFARLKVKTDQVGAGIAGLIIAGKR